jgi:hypothetical protein
MVRHLRPEGEKRENCVTNTPEQLNHGVRDFPQVVRPWRSTFLAAAMVRDRKEAQE